MVKNALVILSAVLLFALWFLMPLLTYSKGTSENVTSAPLADTYSRGDTLSYTWEGDVVRSCRVTIRREFIDQNEVPIGLLPKVFDPPPSEDLGYTQYQVDIPIPLGLAAGPVIYQATEVPGCTWMQRMFPKGIDWPPVVFMLEE